MNTIDKLLLEFFHMQKPEEISPAAGWLATLYSVLVLGDFLRIYGNISQWKVWNGWVKEVQCTLYNWSRWHISSNVIIAFYNLQQAWIHGAGRCILQKLLPDCWKSAPKSITMDEFSKVSPPASIKSWFIHAKFVKLGASRRGRSLQKFPAGSMSDRQAECLDQFFKSWPYFRPTNVVVAG